MSNVFRVGYDLKGDKAHHIAEVSDVSCFQAARDFVLGEFKKQRITRALVLIDCIELCKSQPLDPQLG